MSTHNLDFYEEQTKIILELSSNSIKHAPYLFFRFLLKGHIKNKSFARVYHRCSETVSNARVVVIVDKCTGVGCSKFMMLLVNVLLKFQM